MAKTVSIKYLERVADSDGKTLYFRTAIGSKRSPTSFVDREDIPDPEAGSGWFECERAQRGPWLKWRAIRRVEG